MYIITSLILLNIKKVNSVIRVESRASLYSDRWFLSKGSARVVYLVNEEDMRF